jgi:hypothetical protein
MGSFLEQQYITSSSKPNNLQQPTKSEAMSINSALSD